MKKYAVLKNVARGINFGVVVKSDIDQRFYGWSDKGIEWSDWANRNGGRLENLPIGVSVGEFKSLSDELLQKLIANSDDVAAVDHGVTRDLSRQILVKSERFNNSSKFPSVTTKSIPIAIWDKKIAVQYKVKHFKQSIARSEISLKVRHNELAFNVQTRQFNTKPNRASRLIERHDIRAKMSKGSERIFGGQIVDAINKEILSSERMVLTKRGNVGSHTKEVVDFFVKGRLGYSIGRAGRGGLRSMTPNRGGNRGLRGSASRVISGVLDPRMRRDVDGDGMIFDGTWREMPDPTKFKPNLRTGLGGGRTTRNEIWKTRIVGKPQTPKLDLFDAFDAVQRVNDGDDLNSTFADLWKAVKGRNDWGDLLTDVAAKLSVEKPNINGRNEKEVASSIKNIITSSSSGLSKSKGHRYESSSLGSLTEYVARIATGKDADATDVIASFDDPYAPKGSKAHALEAMVAFGLGKLETPQSRRKYEGNRGFKSRTGSVIDDILYASEGAAEPEMDDLLRKVKMGMTLKQSESRSLLDSLKDIKNNNDEFLGDERLENLINHVSEMSSIGKDNNDLVSNLRFILRDRPDTKLSAMLDKYVNGEKMSDKERASFIQSLTGYAGSREFLDDDRITNLIDELKSRPKNSFIPEGRDMKPRGGNSIGVADGSGRADAIGLADGSGGVDNYTSRGGGVASRSMPAPDRERREGGAAPGGPPPPPNDDDDDKETGFASSTGAPPDYQDQFDFVIGKMFDELPDRNERIQEYLDEGFGKQGAREIAMEKWLELEESENPEIFMDEVNNRIEDLDTEKPGRTGGVSSSTGGKPEFELKPRPSNPDPDNRFDTWESKEIFRRLNEAKKWYKQAREYVDGEGKPPRNYEQKPGNAPGVSEQRTRTRIKEILEEIKQMKESLKKRGYDDPDEARLEFGRSKRKPKSSTPSKSETDKWFKEAMMRRTPEQLFRPGFRSSTNTDPEGVIEELLEQADGANDSVSPLLRRAARNVSSLTKPEQDELIEALNDEYDNGTMAGDKRLKDFIKYIQGTVPSGGTSRGRGVRSGTFKENITQLFRGDGLRSTTGDDDDLGSDMDDAIQAILKLKRGEKLTPEEQKTVLEALKVVKKPNADIDEDERVGLIDMESLVRSGGVASRSTDIDALTKDPEQREVLKAAFAEFDSLNNPDINEGILSARKTMSENFESMEGGGGDLDSGIREVARGLGMDEGDQNKLSAMVYEMAGKGKTGQSRTSDESIDALTKDPEQREVLKAALNEFSSLNDPDGNDAISAARKTMSQNFESMEGGGGDLDSGIREVARGLGMSEDDQNKLSSMLYDAAGKSQTGDKELDKRLKEIERLSAERGGVGGAGGNLLAVEPLNILEEMRDELENAPDGRDSDDYKRVMDELKLRKSPTRKNRRSQQNSDLHREVYEVMTNTQDGDDPAWDYLNAVHGVEKGDYKDRRGDFGYRPDETTYDINEAIKDSMSEDDQRQFLIDMAKHEASPDYDPYGRKKTGPLYDEVNKANARYRGTGGVASRSDDEPSAVKAARKMKRDQKRKLEAEVQMAEVVEMAELLQRWVETGDEVLLARLERKFQNHKWAEDPVTLKNGKPVNPNKNRNAALSALEEAKKEMRSLRGVNSSTSARGPIEQNLTSRMATASTDRASRPRGLSSSTDTSTTKTPVPKDGVKAQKRRTTLLIDKLDYYGKRKGPGDGAMWESLTDEQKTIAKQTLAEIKLSTANSLKKVFKEYWRKATEEGLDKESLRAVGQRARGTGGKYKVRPTDDPLNKDDILYMMRNMDARVANGKLQKFEVDEAGQIVLDEQGRPKLEKTYQLNARRLDDMMTILNMEEEDDFSLLEHLHTESRKKLKTKIGSKFVGKFGLGDSSIAGFAGGEEKATSVDELNDIEIGKAKKEPLGRRLLRVNAARAEKRRQRALRKTGSFRRGGVLTDADPALQLKRAKLRARARRRSMLSKFRRTRDANELSSDMSRAKAETSLIAIDNNGIVKISPRYVATLAKLDADLVRDKSNEENRTKVYDQLLADLWANSGFSGQPTLVTEDESRRLIAAGWQPVFRGTGSEKGNSEAYVEQFLTDESETRFIPGQGMRAYGVGEYFAFSGEWLGYSGDPTDRHTVLGLIPPSADIIGSQELSKERNKMQELTAKSVDALKIFGGRDGAEAATPGELAQALRDAMPSLPQEKSRSAQIVSQLVDRLDELEAMPASTESLQEKKNILNAIDYLHRFTKQKEDGYFAPLIGVDAIDTNNGSGKGSPLLLHNRAGIAAVQAPMTRDEAERLAKNEQGVSIGNITSTWATMDDRRRVVSATPESSGTRSKVGKKRRPSTRRPDPDEPMETTDPTPAVQAPAVQAPGISKSAINTDTWTSSSPPSTGSNPATMLTDPNGTKYYAKLPKRGEPTLTTRERMETEVLAGKLYALAGIPVADLQMGTYNGEPVMLSRMIQTRMPNGKGDNDKARDGFVVDAWLANWDAPLNDNIKVDNNGRPVRLDVGGSLDYRAQGAKKGSGGSTGFGPSVGEMTSMQKSGSSADFTNMDSGELKKQTQKLGTVTDDQIRQTVSAIVSDPARAKILADTLIARRDDIIKRYG